MYSLDRDGVMAGAQVVYGSDGSLYVASRRYVRALELGTDIPEGMRTEIHRFDISEPTKTVYRASGIGARLHPQQLRALRARRPSARGHHRGAAVVRRTARASESQSTVTVLEQNANAARARRLGHRARQGRADLRRALHGRQGYVVTFRQIDPLYTLDLSDPTAPKVVGELKIPGYSAYLHPVGENRLLGIGREGSDVQASLFDVGQLAAPQRVAQFNFGPGRDPGRDRAARLPVLGEGEPGRDAAPDLRPRGDSFIGAAGIRIAPDALSRRRPGRPPQRRRAAPTRPDRALVRDRRPALHAVLARARRRAGSTTSARCVTATRPFKRGAAAPGGEGSGRRGYEGRGRRGSNREVLPWPGGSGGCRPRPWYETHSWGFLKRGLSRLFNCP